jgi:hypothetical protein
MTQNMTVCPDCGDELETTDSVSELPLQALSKQCVNCDYSVDISIINYKSNDFAVIAPACQSDTCHRCGSDALIRSQRVGYSVVGLCVEHRWELHRHALALRDEL